MSQAWLEARLEGLGPDSFGGEKLLFLSSAGLHPPAGFEQTWFSYEDTSNAWRLPTQEQLASSSAILIFGNPLDVDELERLRWLLWRMGEAGAACPPLVLAPHSREDGPPLAENVVAAALRQSLDGMILEEPTGFRLALAVRMKVYGLHKLAESTNRMMLQRQNLAAQAAHISKDIHELMWVHFRGRAARSIPAMDTRTPMEALPAVEGYSVAEKLGQGGFGSVYRLIPEPDPDRHGSGDSNDAGGVGEERQHQVLKVLSKEKFQDLGSIGDLSRCIRLMTFMAGERNHHPALVKLLGVYHTKSFVCFRLTYAGPRNLYKRLQARHLSGDDCRPLTASKTISILKQATAAVTHLHQGLNACIIHRDIKPENFVVTETSGDIELKLVDFDLAVAQQTPAKLSTSCGTIPFTAPEVLLEQSYDAAPIDVWSLGVTVMEIFCGVRFMDRAVGLNGISHPKTVAWRIRAAFRQPGSASKLLEEHCMGNLKYLVPGAKALVDGMLDVNPSTRWLASRAHATGCQLANHKPPRNTLWGRASVLVPSF